ncbi:hypothetical protein FACS1894132_00110 [Clostridia bacterium]|nr:hypothetical protein FACS1894132_00110 [Clostridia bacterium]
MNNNFFSTKRLVVYAMLTAIAFLIVLTRIFSLPIIPVADYLKYDPKDIVLCLGGILFGPLALIITTVAVCFLEMYTVSTTAWFGFFMNFVSTISFAMIPSIICTKTINVQFIKLFFKLNFFNKNEFFYA